MVPDRSSRRGDRRFFAFNAALSIGALAFLGYLLLFRPGAGSRELSFLPAVNAGLNGLAAGLLVAGYLAVKRGHRRAHKYWMVSSFAASALFLSCYVAYHYVHGDTAYPGQGAGRVLYLLVLVSHVLLSMAVLPLALSAFYFALRGRLERHRPIGRLLFPLWLYVSVSGVAIFFMLRAELQGTGAHSPGASSLGRSSR